MNNTLFSIQNQTEQYFIPNYSSTYYSILLFQGQGAFSVDFVKCNFSGNIVLFLSPYQNLQWLGGTSNDIQLLQFHSDFTVLNIIKKK